MSALSELADGRSCVILTDEHVAELPFVESIASNLVCELVTIPIGEPSSSTVDAAFTGIHSDLIVALGGGSVIDTAKVLSVLPPGEPVKSLIEGGSGERLRDLIAVPTTAGSGSEMTRTAIVTVDGRKCWVWGESLRPGAVVLDPDLTVGLAPDSTVASGLDAFVHGVEAVTASSTANSLAVEAGTWAIETVTRHLPRVLATGDLDSRHALLMASAAAGLAIDRCGTGVAHALGHGLGSVAPIAHGLSVAVALAVSAEWSEAGDDPRCNAVARAAGADSFSTIVDRLGAAVGLERMVSVIASEHRLDAEALRTIVCSPMNAPMRLNNVRPADEGATSKLVDALVDRWERLGGRR